MTVTADAPVIVDPDLAKRALGQVLDDDAAAQPDAAPPPARAPIEGATPEAPWGFKPDGSPRKGPPGPGRPRKDPADKPRTEERPAAAAQAAAEPPVKESYAEDIHAALTTAWMGLSLIKWTRGHAAVIHANTPQLATAWAVAAKQNKQVRTWVVKLSGEGSWGWVIPVTAATAPVVLGLWEVTRNAELRAGMAEQNDAEFGAFIADQMKAFAELQDEAEHAGQQAA
jgi:hypothetical protein